MLDMQLKFDPELCFNCDSYACLTKCNYLNYDFEAAKEERLKLARGEYSKVLEECKTCYACEEYCPYGNHPFYRIVELQEEYGVKLADDDVLRELVRRYEPVGEFKPKKVGRRIVHICLFPEFKEAIKGKLFEDCDVVRGRHLFCNLVYLHFGMISVIKERAPKIIENMSMLGAEEYVLYHDECYGFYNHFAKAYGIEIPFKTIHLFEYLYERLKEMEDEIRKLNVKVAYQRNCSNRLCGETDKILDKIFVLMGVERVEREYDRENALCCGAAFVLQRREDLAEEFKRKNVEDIVSSGAEMAVFNCPMCYQTLGRSLAARGVTPIMVSELCKLAIGEEPFMPIK